MSSRDQHLSLVVKDDLAAGFSRYRLVGENGDEISTACDFLDSLATRGLSERTTRTYAYGLLSFWRWILEEELEISSLTEPDLLRYIRFQNRATRGKASARTVNQRLSVVRSLYEWVTGKEFPSRGLSRNPYSRYYYGQASDSGYLRSSRQRSIPLHVKVPRRVVSALAREEVADFLESLRTWRDLSLVGLMLFCGVRSQEVLALTVGNVKLSEGQIWIVGKGNKERVIPLPQQIVSLLESYLSVERPETSTSKLFVCLKGQKRGQAMTASGLRSLFRYHSKRSGVTRANPHRFRHTFGTEMVRAGMSLPALMHLMGHSDIHTTMIYVDISPKEVWEEFYRVVTQIRNEGLRLRPRHDDDDRREE